MEIDKVSVTKEDLTTPPRRDGIHYWQWKNFRRLYPHKYLPEHLEQLGINNISPINM